MPRSAVFGDANVPGGGGRPEEDFLNFEEALAAHTDWKTRLWMYVKGKGELDAAVIRQDDACALGKWIHGQAAQFFGDRDFQALQEEHARFHAVAASVVERVAAGDRAAAEAMIAPSSEFGELSGKVVRATLALRRKARDEQHPGPRGAT